MTYTITFDPSLDCIAVCEDFRLGETNRVSRETIFPGEGIRKLVIEKGIRNEMIRVKKRKPGKAPVLRMISICARMQCGSWESM